MKFSIGKDFFEGYSPEYFQWFSQMSRIMDFFFFFIYNSFFSLMMGVLFLYNELKGNG